MLNQLNKQLLMASTLSVLCIGSLPLQAGTEEFESLSNIREKAEKYALQQIVDGRFTSIEAEAAPMDPRLQLAKCAEPLQATATTQAMNVSRKTIGISCTGSKPWTVYVPVTIDAEAYAVFTSRALARGDELQISALEIKSVPLNSLPRNYISQFEELEGMSLSRAVSAGTILTRNSLKPRQLIQQGQEVLILAQTAGIQVRMSGIAMKNGSSGQRIRVKNSSSGRIVEGTILDESTVLVKM